MIKHIRIIIAVIVMFSFISDSASQQKSKIKTYKRVPKYTISFLGAFGYMLGSANGDGKGFKSDYNLPGGHLFVGDNLGMQQGYGAMVIGKAAVSKNKKFRITGLLGYNLFYNSEDKGRNRTKWNMFTLGGGVEYNFSPKQKERLFVGAELDYNLLFGAWQSDITYPDGYVSNIYTKFNTTSRLGLAATAGMEFKLNRKMDLIIGIRGVWANAFPKQNSYSDESYNTYINDSKDNSGIQFDDRKEMIYMQATVGITLPIGYK